MKNNSQYLLEDLPYFTKKGSLKRQFFISAKSLTENNEVHLHFLQMWAKEIKSCFFMTTHSKSFIHHEASQNTYYLTLWSKYFFYDFFYFSIYEITCFFATHTVQYVQWILISLLVFAFLINIKFVQAKSCITIVERL